MFYVIRLPVHPAEEVLAVDKDEADGIEAGTETEGKC